MEKDSCGKKIFYEGSKTADKTFSQQKHSLLSIFKSPDRDAAANLLEISSPMV